MTKVHDSSEQKVIQTELYEKLIARFVTWAKSRDDIRAALIVGSRARDDPDEWADLDIIVVTTNPEHYLSRTDWIHNIGSPLLTFTEPTATGDERERRVLFEGMLDVDFAILPEQRAKQLLKGIPPEIKAQLADTFGRGIRVLLDKDGMVAALEALIPPGETLPPRTPSKQEFCEVINDFLYHCVWTAKHLCRGELWWSKSCCDSYLKHLLLTMVEWHARSTHGPDYDTWFRGRFLEKWADPRIKKDLRNAFAYYDEKDVKRALLATMDLFRWLACETAEKLGYPYVMKADERVTAWVKTCLSERA
ncbi:MAG: hypothetical protein AYK19_00830 [Theionarchaea archaeon DG-70-1]|nr:MAG: hypothetical protein AYK19_00830 [Theionarchaea archaeon DG-70-1]